MALLKRLAIAATGRHTRTVVISEPDLQAALAHLRVLPYRPTWPASWDRHQLLELIHQAIGHKPKFGESFDVAPGVVARIRPFGIDLAGWPDAERRLQVWLSMRSCGTDPERVVVLVDGETQSA